MAAPAFARYVEQVALPRAIALRETLAERYPFRCEHCGRPCAKCARWCFHCRTCTKRCDECGEEFESRRGKRGVRFCSKSCSARSTALVRARNAKRGRRI